MDSDISFLLFTAILVFLLLLFRKNKWVRLVADLVIGFLLLITSMILGCVSGFFLGYFMFGQVLNINLPLDTIFGGRSAIPEILLNSIRQKIFITAAVGAIFGVVIFIVKSKNERRRNAMLVSISDELIKLAELKEKGIISDLEFQRIKNKFMY